MNFSLFINYILSITYRILLIFWVIPEYKSSTLNCQALLVQERGADGGGPRHSTRALDTEKFSDSCEETTFTKKIHDNILLKLCPE
jgi:hypothetical protein